MACGTERPLDVLLVLQGTAANALDGAYVNLVAAELLGLAVSFDVRVGIVATDLGTGPYDVPTCSSDDGDAAALQLEQVAGCGGSPDRFIDVSPGTDLDSLTVDLRCRTRSGTCAMEQPLEAMLRAVTPSTAPILFYGGTGQADGVNAGFLREGSLLAILLMSTRNDCSVVDRGLFDPESTSYTADLGLRCFEYPAALQPIDRYVSGIVATRPPDALSLFVVGAVPTDLLETPYDAILADSRMTEHLDPTQGTRLAVSCERPGGGAVLEPPVREVAFAAGLEARGVTTALGSLCAADVAASLADFGASVRRTASRCCP